MLEGYKWERIYHATQQWQNDREGGGHNFPQNPWWVLLIVALPRLQPSPRLLVTKELKHGHETSGAMNPNVEATRGVCYDTPILVLRPASGNRSMKPYVIERLFDSLCLVGIVEKECRTCTCDPPTTRVVLKQTWPIVAIFSVPFLGLSQLGRNK